MVCRLAQTNYSAQVTQQIGSQARNSDWNKSLDPEYEQLSVDLTSASYWVICVHPSSSFSFLPL